MTFTLIGPALLNDFAPINPELEARGGVRVRVTGPSGQYDAYQMPDGQFLGEALRVPNAEKLAAMAAATTASTAAQAKRAANIDRMRTLGRRAARFAKDPAVNPGDNFLPGVWATATGAQRTDIRALHELLAKVALTAINELADDA